ncbi:MAG: hypothetical protein P4M14_12415 [Gammaproteobacteria bacterium]|nr:hypothetical protein [Gammaproteobacteria bacterium]
MKRTTIILTLSMLCVVVAPRIFAASYRPSQSQEDDYEGSTRGFAARASGLSHEEAKQAFEEGLEREGFVEAQPAYEPGEEAMSDDKAYPILSGMSGMDVSKQSNPNIISQALLKVVGKCGMDFENDQCLGEGQPNPFLIKLAFKHITDDLLKRFSGKDREFIEKFKNAVEEVEDEDKDEEDARRQDFNTRMAVLAGQKGINPFLLGMANMMLAASYADKKDRNNARKYAQAAGDLGFVYDANKLMKEMGAVYVPSAASTASASAAASSSAAAPGAGASKAPTSAASSGSTSRKLTRREIQERNAAAMRAAKGQKK